MVREDEHVKWHLKDHLRISHNKWQQFEVFWKERITRKKKSFLTKEKAYFQSAFMATNLIYFKMNLMTVIE